MTPPTDPRRPPSEDVSWDFLAMIEGLPRAAAIGVEYYGLLCHAIRSLCDERESLLEQAVQRAEVNADLVAQLSAYVTATEGRPASELIAPSGVARIIEQRDFATQLAEARYKPKLAEYETVQRAYYDQVRGLKEQLAEQDAEIERLRKRIWPNGEDG